jgi:hypothetical protein
MKKLYVRLKGGIGNQMFQFASAYSIARMHNKELVLDCYSGFIRDKIYKRKFSLYIFSINNFRKSFIVPFLFLLNDFLNKFKIEISKYIFLSGDFYKDFENLCIEQLISNNEILYSSNNLFLDGYWQSEVYFYTHRKDIYNLFQLKTPADKKYINLSKSINFENAIAVGIRIYEEVPNNTHNYSPFDFISEALNNIKTSDATVFYVFCTSRHPSVIEYKFPGNVVYITPQDGFDNDIYTMWLFSKFRKFIISHSTYYWWGAWLSEIESDTVEIHAHSVFNKLIPDRWISYS